MSSLVVTFTPGISSDPGSSSPFICHRICYRQGSEGDYCCEEDSTASVAGTPKTFTIDLAASSCSPAPPDVDPDSCTNTAYEGYVQACCESVDSLDGRVAFSATFILDPACVNKLTCCQGARDLTDGTFTITNAGSGYNPASSPLAISVVRDPSDSITAGGTNDADLTATIDGGGTITAINIVTGGLYSKIPLLVIPSPPAGSPAGTTATVIMTIKCADEAWLGNCADGTTELVSLQLGECTDYCYPRAHPFIYNTEILSGDPDITHYSYTPIGCCDCTTCKTFSVVVSSALETVDIVYTHCTTGTFGDSNRVTVTVSGSGSTSISCAVPGSIYCISDPNAILSITETGDCSEC